MIYLILYHLCGQSMLKTQIYLNYLHQYKFEFILTISKFPNICCENIIEADLINTFTVFD